MSSQEPNRWNDGLQYMDQAIRQDSPFEFDSAFYTEKEMQHMFRRDVTIPLNEREQQRQQRKRKAEFEAARREALGYDALQNDALQNDAPSPTKTRSGREIITPSYYHNQTYLPGANNGKTKGRPIDSIRTKPKKKRLNGRAGNYKNFTGKHTLMK